MILIIILILAMNTFIALNFSTNIFIQIINFIITFILGCYLGIISSTDNDEYDDLMDEDIYDEDR